jgi:hypothetical protein
MFATAIFGFGGGSDFYSASLIASSIIATDNDPASDNIIILTAFFRIVKCVAIDLTHAIRKYTGLPYFTATGEKNLRAKFYREVF